MSIFDWFKNKSTVDGSEKTRSTRYGNSQVDFTDNLIANTALTKGIYNNTYPGFKLAGFGYNIINVPVSFMGLPVVKIENEKDIQEYFNNFINKHSEDVRKIHIQCHRDGTVWVFPRFDKNNGLTWDIIQDDSVYKILRDINTKEIIQIITQEDITVNQVNSESIAVVTKKVTYTKTKIKTEYTGNRIDGLKNSVSINVAKILPVHYSNNADVNEVRGHSEFERILSDMKVYHDVELAESTALAKFVTKMIQTVKSFDNWIKNNFNGNVAAFTKMNIQSIDFVVNEEGEKTEFVHPSGMVDGYEKKLKTTFHKIVEISGYPEIIHGLKMEGNVASVETQMSILMQKVEEKQAQKVDGYVELITGTYNLLVAAMELPLRDFEIQITWDVSDAMSEETRANIFQKFADAISKLVGAAALTKQQLYKLWKKQYPSITDEELEPFIEGIQKMVAHTVSIKSSATDLLDAQGINNQ